MNERKRHLEDCKFVGWALIGLAFGVLALMASGCSTTAEKNLSQTREQARQQGVTEGVRMAMVEKGTSQVADFLSNVPESGAVGYAENTRLRVDPATGGFAKNPDGSYVMEKAVAIGKSNSMREIDMPAGQVELHLVLGGMARNPKTGDFSDGGAMDGLWLWITAGGLSSGLDTDFAAVWANAPAAEKLAAAEAVAKAITARIGGWETVIDATGRTVKGILKEVGKSTPIGAGLAAVEVLLDDGGTDVTGTIVERFAGMPDGE